MTTSNAYNTPLNKGRMQVIQGLRIVFLSIILLLLLPGVTVAQDEPGYDETSVYLKIARIGGGEVSAVIKGEEVYLPITELFDFLKIRNIPSEDLDLITGFFISPEATFTIDRKNNRIIYGDETFDLAEGDLVRSESNLYLRSLYFGKIFGLDCKFNFRELSVVLETQLELPIIREMKLEEMRQNLKRLKGDVKVDTTVGRTFPGFRFGMADWSVIANEQVDGPADVRLNLNLGAVIAGGEATASLNYYSQDPLTEKQQYYLWRYVNNDNNIIRQFMAGKIAAHATSSIYEPVVGVQITNTPTTFRRSFGSYTLTDETEPGWLVELYVNNVMVDYIKADASGFFTFEVPLVYGNSMVKLKFYGPWGEERTREQNIIIPFNFLPEKTLEYTVSAGIVEDSLMSRYSRGSVNYGVTRSLTMGGGVEYLSSVTSSPVMPYLNTSLRVTRNLLLSGEYTFGVRAKGTLTYRLPSNMQIDLNYTKYDKDQEAINYKYLEERRASVSVPIRTKNYSAYTRLSYYQIVLPLSDYTTGEWLLSAPVFGINTNLSTFALFVGQNKPYIYSNLSMSFRLPAGFIVMPQAQYGFTRNELLSARIGLEKRMFEHGYLSMSYEQNFRSNLRMGELGFRYDFAFAQTGFSARQTNDRATLVQYARGSIINDGQTKYLKADNRTNVGRGGITILPYLDLNANEKRDPGEPAAYGLNVHTTGGRVEKVMSDTTMRIFGLEPYVKYFIELDENGFENISWRLRKKSYAVIADPNQLKLIEVPVTVEGEATGTVMVESGTELRGLGRIIVNFYKKGDRFAGRTLSEDDGYYSFFGLTPGSYYARIDTSQLRKLRFTSSPDSIAFEVKTDLDGDYIEGLDFVLKKLPADTTGQLPVAELVVESDTTYLVIHEEVHELVTITEDNWAIQLGAFRNRAGAQSWLKRLSAAGNKDVEIVQEDGLYKVRVTGFKDRAEVDAYVPALQKAGFNELWIIHNKAKRVERITTKQDSIARITETVVERPRPVIVPGTTIQIATLQNQEEASAIIDRLLAAVENIITVRNEGGLFKVQITDIQNTEDIENLIPILEKKGFRGIVLIGPEGTELVPVTPVPVDSLIAEEAVVIPEKQAEVVIPEVKQAPPVPGFALHAGRYFKRIQAERAKARIIRKLQLPVEIIQEWDSYRVVVTGFFTPEETFRYYPELAGLGFTEVYVMELPKPKKQ